MKLIEKPAKPSHYWVSGVCGNSYKTHSKRIYKLVGEPFRNPSGTLSKQGTGSGTGSGSGTGTINICANSHYVEKEVVA